jgi:two-component system NarL family sensor kinase
MKYQVVLGLLLVSCGVTLSQTHEVDPKTLNDSAKYYHDHSNFDKAREFAQQAMSLAENSNNNDELFKSYTILGNISYRKGKLGEAQRFHKKSLIVAIALGETNLRAKALSNLATLLSQLGQYDSAGTMLNEIFQLHNVDEEIIIASYGRMGLNHKRQQQYDKAIVFYIKSLSLSQKRNDSLSSARTLANIGNIYMEQDEPTRALEHYRQALSLLDSTKHALSISGISVFAADAHQKLKEYDKAEEILKRSLTLIRKLNLPASEAYALESMGILHFSRGQWHESISAFNDALKIQRSLDSWSALESILIQVAECYIRVRQFDKAQTALDESLQIARAHNHSFGFQSIYQLRSSLDSARGDFRSAFLHHKKYVHYKDSLFTIEKAKAVEEVNRKFEAQQKVQIIEEQQRIIEQQRLKELFFLLLSIIIFAASTAIYMISRRRRRLKEEVVRKQRQKEKLVAVVMAQEQMQQKIARDLHDSFVQVLGAAKIKLESTKTLNTSPEFKSSIHETAHIIDRACADARTIAHQLLPYSLEKHGLTTALQELLEKHPKKGKEEYIFTHEPITSRFQKNIEINVYRVVQELINNTIKHADANRVQVFLSQQNGNLVLSFSDDGKGFNPDETSFGAGLMNIESRLQSVRGSMRIESEKGAGTTTVIQIPLI